jgi:enoyl-[acyl-carrier protein] reductase I
MEGANGAVVCLSYYGAEKVVPNYNVMGVAKAALESSPATSPTTSAQGIRVNAISAGPIKTVSAMGVVGLLGAARHHGAEGAAARNVTQETSATPRCFLLSDIARGITGQVIYVDAGYSILGI